ncbi:MAG TPA: helix-turn-helix domain-containing protein [Povalibacter sp.]|nr:helix-turn-helix domain-containing protein [Povalibacter sp.]
MAFASEWTQQVKTCTFRAMSAIVDRRRRAAAPAAIPAFFLYGEPLRTTDERTIHAETIAARSSLHAWHIRPHRHRDLHQVLLLQRGAVAASIDACSASLPAPGVLIVPPASVHSFRFREDTVGLVISFGSDLAREIVATTPGLLDFLQRPAVCPLARAAIRSTDLESLADMLLREFARSAPGRDMALSGLLSALLANLLRLTRAVVPNADSLSRDHELVARYRQLIEQRYREHAGIATYARTLGTSETRLRKACLAATGQSPIEIAHQRLLVEAERQLRYTSMTVNQIAYFLGFEDPAYFSRFFTQRMRTSPRAFRNGDRAATEAD